MNNSIVATLTGAGLTTKQAAVYVALLQLGEAPVSRLAEATGLKRPLVYLVLEDLIRLGYVSEIPKQKVRRFSACDPQRLYHSVTAAVENLRTMLPILRSLHLQNGPHPLIEIHETVPAITAAYRDMEYSTMSRYLTSYEQMQRYFPHEVERWIHRGLSPRDINHSRHILSPDPSSRRFADRLGKHDRHHVRFLPDVRPFTVDVAILDGDVGFTSFDPLFLVIIHSRTLADTLAVLFDTTWNTLASSNTKPKNYA